VETLATSSGNSPGTWRFQFGTLAFSRLLTNVKSRLVIGTPSDQFPCLRSMVTVRSPSL
jgi:hypothetical protein